MQPATRKPEPPRACHVLQRCRACALRLGLGLVVGLVSSACGPSELPAFANPPPDDASAWGKRTAPDAATRSAPDAGAARDPNAGAARDEDAAASEPRLDAGEAQ